MVRSQWLGAVVAGLAWTGLLWSQSPASPSPAPNLSVGATITVNETGKPPEQCQVQASWTEPSGTRVLQVRSISSGEMITVMSQAQPGVYRVYRWGQSSTPPPGVPTQPAPAAARPAPHPSPVGPAALAAGLPPPAPVAPATPPRAPTPMTAQAPSGIIPVSAAPTPAGNVMQAASTTPAAPTAQSAATLPILPQPRESSAPAATPAINPAPYNPTIALPAINTRSPQQPTLAQPAANGPAAPAAGPISSSSFPTQPNTGPVSSGTSAPAGNLACGGCGHTDGCCGQTTGCCGQAASCPTCANSCCAKPSLWSRLFGKSDCGTPCGQTSCCQTCPQTTCATCPQTSCCQTCPQTGCSTCASTGCAAPSCASSCTSSCASTPSCTCCPSCGKPSLWSRMFGKSDCCQACPTCPTDSCGTCGSPAPAAPAAHGSSTPQVAPHMPSVSQSPTAGPQVSDYRQSWGKVEPWSTTPGMQTTTAAKPNEAAPAAAPAPGSERLAPVAPTATAPTETAPIPMAPLAAPPRKQLFSRLRGNKQPVMQEVIPMEQVPGTVTTPAPTGVPLGQGGMPVVMMPPTDTSRRSVFSRPLFRGRQAPQNAIPFDPSAPAVVQGTPGAEGQPIVHTVDGHFPKPAGPGAESEQDPSRRSDREMADGKTQRWGLFGGRSIEVDADSPNAFTPPSKKEKKDPREEERYGNAFPVPADKMHPQYGMNPMLPPPRMPQAPWQMPQAPFTNPQAQQQMPMAADAGIPRGLANAFTPSWTGRPLPADLDNRPQPTNGFGEGENMNSPPPVPQAAQMAGANAFPGSNGGMMMAAGPRMPAYLPAPDGGRQSVTAGYPPAGALPPSLQRTTYSATLPHMTLPASAALPAQALSTPQMLIMLRESLYPSQREWAAEQLSHLDWHREQVVVASLVQGAREDPAPAVRAACVHALGSMRVNTLPVVQTVQALQKDKDIRVRQEVAETLTALGATAPGRAGSDGSLQRVGGSVPAE